MRALWTLGTLALLLTGQPAELPSGAVQKLRANLRASGSHAAHVWRDTPPVNPDGTITAYVEIPRGDRRKWEFDMSVNASRIDRVIPEDVGGYPVNYGFVPQTVSYDGDPFDALVLGPPLANGTIVRGVPVGLMHMHDQHLVDSKVVLSLVGDGGGPVHTLTAAAQQAMVEYFGRYKRHEPGALTAVPGWGSAGDGRRLVDMTHAFFRLCRADAGVCRIEEQPDAVQE